METTYEHKFHIVKSEKKNRVRTANKPMQPLDWLSPTDDWNKKLFETAIVDLIESSQGVNTYANMVLVQMLCTQVDLYVQCIRQIADTGLVEAYNKGANTGPSIHFTMADKALNRALQIMKELGLTPAHRVGVVRNQSPEAIDLEEFLAGP
jgi:phage terminase small subunit